MRRLALVVVLLTSVMSCALPFFFIAIALVEWLVRVVLER
jgi:hypothetical protein